MITIAGIDHVVLNTNKIKAMINFYCDILGCVIEKEQPNFKLTQLRAGICLIDLIETDNIADGNKRNMNHFCLQIKDFNYENLKQYLQEKGIETTNYNQRYGAQGSAMSFNVIDPEGNTVELKEYKIL